MARGFDASLQNKINILKEQMIDMIEAELEFDEFIDAGTGEYRGKGMFIPKDQYIKSVKDKERREKFAKIQIKKTEFSQYINYNYGTFYFNNYVKLLKTIDNDTALAFRFLYLCTFANFDGYLMFGNIRHDKYTDYMTEKDYAEVFKLSPAPTNKLQHQLLDLNLVIKTEDNKLKINDNFFIRGKLTNKDKTETSRVFDNGVKKLYEISKPREHRRLGIVIALLPYINIHYNIVCSNPCESNIKYIRPLTIRDICELTNYDFNNAEKLRKNLASTEVNELPLVAYISHSNGNFFIVNPAVFYKGNQIEDIRAMMLLFDVVNKH